MPLHRHGAPPGELPERPRFAIIRASTGNASPARMSPLSDTVTVRAARPQDAERVAAMCARLSAAEGEPPPAFTAECFRREGFGATARFEGLVAELAGEAVGYLLHCPDYDTDLMLRCHFVIDLFVEKTARRRGVGRALMATAAAIARSRGSRLLAWTVLTRNERARRFYAGFSEEQSDTVMFWTPEDAFAQLAASPAPPHVDFRAAQAADVPTIAAMEQALLVNQGDTPPAGIAEAFQRDGFGADPAFRVVLAERAGRIAGFALYWPLYDTDDAAPFGMLSDLYVEDWARRGGIGRALVAEVARQMQAEGGSFLAWPVRRHNAPALAFHATIGEPDDKVILCRCAGESFARLADAGQLAAPA
jgi:GNAT superfamily N-acetyltransferase